MQDFSDLYNTFNQLNEQRKRDNFNIFMSSLISGLENDLDKMFTGDEEKYKTALDNVKSKGFRVFRNSAGKHKVVPG